MAGTLLSPDQIQKLNAAFPALVAHLRSLLVADHTGYGLMRVHTQVESFDSDEMVRIFNGINFVMPNEKKALVRAAIYELMAAEPALFVSPLAPAMPAPTSRLTEDQDASLKVFTPPAFKLNVNKSSDFHGQAPADTPAPAPVVTSTHTPKINAALEAGKVEQTAQTEKLNAAVAKLRAANTPVEVSAPDAPQE